MSMEFLYPALAKGLSLADTVVPKFFWPGLDPDALIKDSGARPDAAAREGLRQLLAAMAADTELSFFGQVSMHWDFLRLLRNTQIITDAHEANPALAQAAVVAPIFILGLPRSGTTFLHGLMAEDAGHLVPRHWQTITPAPRPADFNPAADKRVQEADQQLKIFASLAPGFEQQHPMTADSPQECCEITAHVFQSLRFDTTLRVPDYLHWLDAFGHLPAFTFHKQFLQYLQNGVPSRWVLKCPDHTFSLEAILQVYPDARFILVHRDPLAVLGSVAQLTEVLRKPFLKHIDLGEIGEQVSTRWIEGANLLLQFDQRTDVPADRKIHIHYKELTGAPLETIARIYERFGIPFSAGAQAAMTQRVTDRPRGGYAVHAPYSLDTFKLSAPNLKLQFAPYVSQYCREAGPIGA
jgi:hypothetical protein